MPFLSKKVPKLFSNKNRSSRRWSTNEANVHTTRRKTMGGQIQLFRQLSLVLENKKSMAQNAKEATAAAAAAISQEEDDDEEREHDSRRGGLFGMPSRKKFGSSRKLIPKECEQEPPTIITTTTTRTSKQLFSTKELSEEDDSTFESSPTPTPNNDRRETLEMDATSLPDVPKLNFPSHNEEHQLHPTSMHNKSDLNPSRKQGRRQRQRQRHSVSDMRSSALKPSSSSRNRIKYTPKPQFLNQYDDEGEYEEYINRIKGLDDIPPPVDHVSFSSTNSKPSPVFSKTRRCISAPPLLDSEWDDETIESHCRDETDEMKPWIDRASKLALLQNKANQHDRHSGQDNTMDYDYDYLDRRRLTPMKWETPDASASAVVALPRFRPGMDCSHPTRARMASEQHRRHRHQKHKRHNQTGAQSKQPGEELKQQQERKTIEDFEQQEQDKMPLPPVSPHRRLVKLTTVRQSAGY